MPLVFIHGVNVRQGATAEAKKEFADAIDARDRLFRTVGLAGLVPPPSVLHIENPYWGGHGVTFSHNLASLPDPGTETFGPGADDAMAQVLTETLPPAAAETATTAGGKAAVLLTLARQDSKTTLPLAVDAAVAAAAHRPVAGDAAAVAEANEALARFAAAATAYLRSGPDTSWLFAKHKATGEPLLQDDNQFLEALTQRVAESAGPAVGPETFGPGSLLDRLKGAGAALGQAVKTAGRAVVTVAKGVVGAAVGSVGRAAAGTAVKLLRPVATQRAGIFLGDVLTYLQQRGDKNAPGEIVKVVRDALRSALAKQTPEDSQLVVICHSMGGNILYDVLTHFDPAIPVDLWVTVGSQVALFKEMRLYLEDRDAAAVGGAAAKTKKPAAVKTWLNVFDPLDVLGFAAGAVFDGVTDYAFSTQANPLDAHSMYFHRPSFHERLRVRMAWVGLGVAP